MLSWIRDTTRSLQVQARTRRLMAEQVLKLTERTDRSPVSDADEGDWMSLGGSHIGHGGQLGTKGSGSSLDADTLRTTARQLARRHPYAANYLRLLEVYVAGAEPRPTHEPRPGQAVDPDLLATADRLWTDFLDRSDGHWSIREHARRSWRDGETFVRKFSDGHGMPAVRFIDPERIGSVSGTDSNAGLVPDGIDAETTIAYLKIASDGGLAERINARDMLHSRVSTDSNELRGRSVLEPLIESLDRFDGWLDIELQARKLQASIVLWRKVSSGGSFGQPAGSGPRQEAIGAGTIVTTGPTTDLQFLQPATNFGDAVPLGRMLLLSAAAAAGVPEFMLTADASNANFASTMVAEGPAVKLFLAHQRWLGNELSRLWRWVMQDAVDADLLPVDALDKMQPRWIFPELVARDRPAERRADVALVAAGVLSPAEVARRDGVDPTTMRAEINAATDENAAGESAADK